MEVIKFKPIFYPAVKKIYQEGLDTGNASFQKVAKEWDEWDSSMLKTCRLIASESDKIFGWAALSAVSNRCVYNGVAEVSVYVDLCAQGRGVGSMLLSELIKSSEMEGIWMLQAGIFPENNPSVRLHKKNGFRIVGRREKLGCMDGIWRDVLLLERRSSCIGV